MPVHLRAVLLWKAQPVGDRVVPDLVVEAKHTVPEDLGGNLRGEAFMAEHRRRYRDQATALVEAMTSSLPGGLIDAILLKLLEHRVSVLKVPYEVEKT